MNHIRSIALFCASAEGSVVRYRQVAAEFGLRCAHESITLYYGGARLGLMHAAAGAALSANGRVVGVVPSIFAHDVVVADNLSELITVSSMSERKQLLERSADGFAVLPGAYGTMDELFEILTDAQLGLHHKPIVILNAFGYYDLLLQQLQRFEQEGFLRPFHQSLLKVAETVDQVFELMDSYEYGNDPQWLDKHMRG